MKKYAIIGIIIILFSAWYFDRNKVKDESFIAGYNQAQIDEKVKQDKAAAILLKKAQLEQDIAKAELNKAWEESNKWKEIAKELQNVPKQPLPKVINIAPKEVCTTVHNDIISVYNAANLLYREQHSIISKGINSNN